MSYTEPLIPGEYYHIYNRGNNRENLFVTDRNYRYFIKLYADYVEPVAFTFAYCLMPNHLHLLVRIKDWQSLQDCQSSEAPNASRQFADMFSTYTKAFNRAYERTGSLFSKPFRRKRVDSTAYFQQLVIYIHRNPQQHRFVADYADWPYSSYDAMVRRGATKLQRATVLDWFDGRNAFIAAHRQASDFGKIEPLLLD